MIEFGAAFPGLDFWATADLIAEGAGYEWIQQPQIHCPPSQEQ
jgi:hypothetical protein